MTWLNWLVGGIALVIILALPAYFVWKWRQQRAAYEAWAARFQPMLGFTGLGVTWQGASDPVTLGQALLRSIDVLSNYGPWTRPEVEDALKGARIEVMPVLTWTDEWGRKVAGYAEVEATPVCIHVGSDLAALCHECAEVIYTKRTGLEDWQAVQWTGQCQVTEAVAQYLKGKPAQAAGGKLWLPPA